MCEFCTMKNEPDSAYTFLGTRWIGFGNVEKMFGLQLYLGKENHTIGCDFDDVELNDIANVEVEIRYCPFCGKKL